jgi:PGF-CTERM protein
VTKTHTYSKDAFFAVVFSVLMVSSMAVAGVTGVAGASGQTDTAIETDGTGLTPSAETPESDEEAGPDADQNITVQSDATEIIVEDIDDLQAVQNNLNANVILRNDIDASETENWNNGKGFDPIGDQQAPFTGTFDGRGYTIENLTINRPNEQNVGLFGYAGGYRADATIENVRLENAEITGGSQTGGLAGTLEEGPNSNSFVLNTSVTGDIKGSGSYAGGLVGFPTGGGSGQDAYGPVLDEENRFSGTVTGDDYVGGLIGRSNFGTEMGVGYVKDATITGDTYVGGLLGFSSYNPSTFDEMYVSATVESSNSAGAVVGRIGDDGGGGEGLDQFPDVYWDNTVESSEYVGEFTGSANPNADRDEPVGLRTDQMVGDAAQANMDGFDFDTRWVTRTSPEDYPSFTWEVQTPDSPTAVITLPTTTIRQGESLSVTATESDGGDGEITSYDWEFGDGSDATGEDAQHTYTEPGDYTIELTVEGPTGIATDTVDISVIDEDAADFTVNPSTVEVGEEVEFSSADGNRYNWTFGDGTSAVGAEPVHTYDSAGTYTVTIAPESEAVTREVTVNPTGDIRIVDIDPEYTGPVVEGLDVSNEYAVEIDSERDVESVVLEIDGSEYPATQKSAQIWNTTVDLSVVDDDTLVNVTATDDLGRTATAEDAIRYNPSPEWFTWMIENAESTQQFTDDDIAVGREFTLVDEEVEVNQLPGSPWEDDFRTNQELQASVYLLAPEGNLQLGVDGSGEVAAAGVETEIRGGGSGEINDQYQLVLVTAELGGEVRAPVWQAGFNPPVVDSQNIVVYGIIAVDTTAEFEGGNDGIEFNKGLIAPEGGLEARTTLGVSGAEVEAIVDGRVGGEAKFTLEDSYLQTVNLTASSEVEGNVKVGYFEVGYGPRELYSESMTVLDPGSSSTASRNSISNVDKEYTWEVVDKRGTQPAGASKLGVQTNSNTLETRLTDRGLEDTHPATTTISDETAVIWSRQDESKSVTAGRDLAVRVNNGSWSETQWLTNDNSHDENPDVATLDDNSTSLVAWERVDTTEVEDNTPEEFFSETELAVATADGESPTEWSQPELLSNDTKETLTYQPVVAANESHWVVAWERNTANDPETFDNRAVEYALISPTADGISVEKTQTIEGAMRPDVTARSDGGFSLGYYTPANGTTTGDIVQATIDKSGSISSESTYSVETFGDLTVSNDQVAWSEGSGPTERIQYVQGSANPTELELSGGISGVDDIELTSNSESVALTYRGTPGENSTRDIVYRFKQNGEWSADQRVAGGNDNLTVWHADTTPSGDTFQTAYAAQPFGTDGINDIFVEEQAIGPRHTVTATSDEEVAAGEQATIEYTVENVGTSSNDEVTIELVANGTVKQTDTIGPLKANEVANGSFEETVSGTGQFEVRIGGISRNAVTSQTGGNEPWLPTSSTVSVATPALGVGEISPTVTETTREVTVNVSNAGNATATDIPVAILTGSTKVANKTISTIEANSQKSVTFDVELSAVDDQQIESVVIDQNNTLPSEWIADRGEKRNTWLFQPDLSIDGSVSYQNRSGDVFAEMTLSNAGDRPTPANITVRNAAGETIGEETIQIGAEPQKTVFENARISIDEVPAEGADLRVFIDSPVPDATPSTTARSETFGPVIEIEPPEDDARFNVTITDTNSPVEAGKTLTVNATVSNVGEKFDSKDVTLTVPGVGSATKSAQLVSGDTTDIELSLNTTSGDVGNYTGSVETPDDSQSTAITIEEQPDEAAFEVAVADTNSPVEEGETLTVDTTITNTGEGTATKAVTLSLPGVGTTTKSVRLDGAVSRDVTFNVSTSVGDAGTYTATVETPTDSATVGVTVEDQPDAAFFEIQTVNTTSPVEEGNTVTVETLVRNTGNQTDEKEVTLSHADLGTDTESVTLDSGESTTQSLSVDTAVGDAGNYTLKVTTPDDEAEVPITVDEQSQEAGFAVNMTVSAETVTEGTPVEINYSVTNLGAEPATQPVVGTRNGTRLFETNVSLSANETTTENATYTPGSDDVGIIALAVETETSTDTEIVTVVAETDNDGSSSGGGGSGGALRQPSSDGPEKPEGTSVVNSVSQTVADFNSDVEGTTVIIPETRLETIGFSKEDLSGSVDVFELNETPEYAPELDDDQPFVTGFVIDVNSGLTDESATLTATIPSEQVEAAGADADELVVLHLHNGEYEQLETNVEGDGDLTVSAETPGFSTFIISTGDQVEESDNTTSDSNETAGGSDDTDSGSDDTAGGSDNTTDESDDTGDGSENTTDETDDDTPGFGVLVTVVALLATALLVTRRELL